MTATLPPISTIMVDDPAAAGSNDAETIAGYAAVREHFGISAFDSLGKLRVRGEAARDLLDVVLTGTLRHAPENTIRASLALREDGRILTDVAVYCGFDDYLVLAEQDALPALHAALEARADDAVEIEDLTDALGVVRVDGPSAADLPRRLIGPEAAGLRLMTSVACAWGGEVLTIGRIGSAGEYGYQFLGPRPVVAEIAARARDQNPKSAACAGGVYDLLFLEMRNFNRRRDLPRDEPPLAAGLHWMIDFRKPEFVGREALLVSKAHLVQRMVCVRLAAGAPVPGTGDPVSIDGRPCGYIANAAYSPGLRLPIALAYVDAPLALVGVPLTVTTRDGGAPGATVSAPFLRTRSNSPQSVGG